MSPQPSPIGRLSLEAPGAGDALVFGDDAQSSLTIPKALMAQLWGRVNEGTRKLSRGGLEVGGLLVGPKVRGGRVVADGIVPVAIEYRHGPSFHTSPSDLANIARAVGSVQSDPSRTVVGFYRSRTRGEETLRENDRQILEAIKGAHPSFAMDFRCCFILAPTSDFEALACIAMRNGAGWDEMQPFKLQSDPLCIVARPPAGTVAPVIPVPVAKAPVQPVNQPVAVKNHDESRGARPVIPVWLYAVAGLLVIAAGMGVYRWMAKKQPQPVSGVQAATASPRVRLGFSATLESPVWKLSWDRAAMDELNPVGAVLSIEDGGTEQHVDLAPADLASGTIFYTPQSSDLSFSLRIDRNGTQVEEHVRVLGAHKVAPPAASQAPVQMVAKSRGVALPERQPVAAPTPDREAKPAAAPAPAPAAAAAPVPPPAPPPTTVAVAVPIPPPIDPPKVVPPPAPIAQPAPPPAPAPAPARVEQAAATAPVPPVTSPAAPITRAPVTVPPAAVPAVQQTYVGPKPIQQVLPQLSGILPSGMTQVQVKVEINARGKVTKVNPIGWTSTNARAMVLVVQAASSWVFDPAKLDGRAIPSEMNLTFRVNGSQ